MIGPADIEAWSDDEHEAAKEPPCATTSARVLPFTNLRALGDLHVKRSRETFLAWQRRLSGRRV